MTGSARLAPACRPAAHLVLHALRRRWLVKTPSGSRTISIGRNGFQLRTLSPHSMSRDTHLPLVAATHWEYSSRIPGPYPVGRLPRSSYLAESCVGWTSNPVNPNGETGMRCVEDFEQMAAVQMKVCGRCQRLMVPCVTDSFFLEVRKSVRDSSWSRRFGIHRDPERVHRDAGMDAGEGNRSAWNFRTWQASMCGRSSWREATANG